MSALRVSAPTVLIVDDDEDIRLTVRSLLELEQFTVVDEAGDGYDAIRLVRHHRPQVVVLDDRMPYLNGAVAASEIRSLVPGVTIVAFSAYYSTQMGVPEWADAVVDKTQMEALVQLMRALPEPPPITRHTIRITGDG